MNEEIKSIEQKIEGILSTQKHKNLWCSKVTQMLMNDYGTILTSTYLKHYVNQQCNKGHKLVSDKDYTMFTRTNIRTAIMLTVKEYE